MNNAAQQWTKWKALALTGAAGTEPALPVKRAAFPAAVQAGILTRYLALVKTIKNHKNYNASIGPILGIDGADQVGPDLTTIQQVIDAKVSGGNVKVTWGWGGNSASLDMCEI